MPRCPECGAEMKYNRDFRRYICTGCGVMMTLDEILDEIDKRREERKDIKEEYLEWWLSRKK
jgi:transcription initiation factor TFIIIB Brf1 subunit/transcription initiation factor TFIIB